ncbi:hypothetical protein R8Z50_22795 [Longispora sp. K20-0274]|uniref:hypothetical protein n=1 Tax=Longispora sp. K20-0274 TaxID=3088255 RepID=UPI00399A550D
MNKFWFPLDAAIDIIDAALDAAGAAPLEARLALRPAEGIQLTPGHTYGGNGVGGYHADGPWAFAEHHGHHTTRYHRQRCGVTLPEESIYLAVPAGLGEQAQSSRDAGCRWMLVNLTGEEPRFAFHPVNLDRPHAVAGWDPALVHFDEDEDHGYPALVATSGEAEAVLRPAFSRAVIEQITADLAARAVGNSLTPTIRLATGHIEIVRKSARGDGRVVSVTVITPDERGRYQIADPDEPEWWSVDADTADAMGCGCAAGCQCPTKCPNEPCGQPLGSTHDPLCHWAAGSAPYEQPQIPAQPVVLVAHTHLAGCPHVIRHPRGLFTYWATADEDWDCDFCGTTGSRDLHTVHHKCGTVSYHQRCTRCLQEYTLTDATCTPTADSDL